MLTRRCRMHHLFQQKGRGGAGLQCLQYKTDQQADLRKIEKLNNLFFSLMAAHSQDTTAGKCSPAMQPSHYAMRLPHSGDTSLLIHAEPAAEPDGKVDADDDTEMGEAAASAVEANHHGSNHKAGSASSRSGKAQPQPGAQRQRNSRRQKG